MRQQLISRVKSATAALAVVDENAKGRPFFIFGSGFCIHYRGLIVTCRHVLEKFMNKRIDQLVAKLPGPAKEAVLQPISDMRSLRPYVLFYGVASTRNEVVVITTPVEAGMAKMDLDLGMVRVAPHKAFPRGYPSLDIEDYNSLYEGMELGTCGFPLGTAMQDQIGTVTSSFTFGHLSSIIPAPGVPEKHASGFQLDLTATHGNSGGPVYSAKTGRVFGVLQRGVLGQDQRTLAGIVNAEPVYPLTSDRRIISDMLTITEDEMQRRLNGG